VVEQDTKSEDLEVLRNVGKGRKKKLLELEKDRDGNPQLPNLKHRETEPNRNELGDIIRAFFTHSYSELQSCVDSRSSPCLSGAYTANDQISVPWGQIATLPSSRLKGWDNSVLLGDPSKMSAEALSSLYTYLMQRGLDKGGRLEWITSGSDKNNGQAEGIHGGSDGQNKMEGNAGEVIQAKKSVYQEEMGLSNSERIDLIEMAADEPKKRGRKRMRKDRE